ncbi:MAG: DUF255 domain-containing protein [Gammaproteobacteria bacterium]|nr:DUF255 domain-containing protein [Gammaproteobacteria bacterium]
MAQLLRLVTALGLAALAYTAGAWEHENSKVEFVEYREGLIEELRESERPYFLLFSAEWCFWCHQFGKFTLTDERVAQFLNKNYNNIFIDADIHNAAYVKYRATGLPYTVFLNPDTSPHFRYSGTLYADDFLTVLKQVKTNVSQGLSVEGQNAAALNYEAPKKLVREDLENTVNGFRAGVLDSFDPVEHGLGKGEKAVYPRTFLHLLERADGNDDAVTMLRKTLERAIEKIYDPVEGGFFRYAETREWKVPHYEKMADLNAGAVLLLHRVNARSASPVLIKAADKTLSYLETTLFNPEIGAFLSFQQADEHYYFIPSREDRAKAKAPAVIEKIFIDRLALTVTHLLDVLEFRPDDALRRKLASSLEFVAREIRKGGKLKRFYAVESGTWSQQATLQDYALVAEMFVRAAARLGDPVYRDLARRSVNAAIERFYDPRLGILTDPLLGGTDDAEVLTEVNGLLATSMIALDQSDTYGSLIASIMTYFSAMGEVFEERVWEGRDWEFTERYVPYLQAATAYLRAASVASN